MSKKWFAALLCAVMLSGSMTVYAETTDGEGGDVPAQVEVTDVIESLSITVSGSTRMNIYDAEVGKEYSYVPEVTVSFTDEWKGAQATGYTLVLGECTMSSDCRIEENTTWIITPSEIPSFDSISVKSVEIKKDDISYTFNLNYTEPYSDNLCILYFKEGSQTTEPEKPSDGGSDNENPAPDNGQDREEAAPVVEVQKNVVNAGGMNVTSTVNGIYSVKAVEGVAVKTSNDLVSAAAGIDSNNSKDERIALYVCDNRDKEEQKVFGQAAALLGCKMVSVIDVDMYHFSGNSCKTVIGTQAPIEIVVALPAWAAKQGGNFSILCVNEEGQLVQMPDTDTNPATITVQTSCFGVYAVVVG